MDRTALGSRRRAPGAWEQLRHIFPTSHFFRTEATNMLKPKEGNPGPNPTRTHLGKGKTAAQEESRMKRRPGFTERLQQGLWTVPKGYTGEAHERDRKRRQDGDDDFSGLKPPIY